MGPHPPRTTHNKHTSNEEIGKLENISNFLPIPDLLLATSPKTRTNDYNHDKTEHKLFDSTTKDFESILFDDPKTRPSTLQNPGEKLVKNNDRKNNNYSEFCGKEENMNFNKESCKILVKNDSQVVIKSAAKN